MSNNKSQKHHYLPVFYLKRWAKCSNDGKLVEFSRPHGPEVKPRRVAPAGTGFLDRLYAIDGLPLERAQQVEEEFMQPVDTVAADALALLEAGDPEVRRSVRYRSSWSLFLMSLMMRMPNDLRAFKSSYARRWLESSPKLAKAFAERTGSDFPRAEAIVQATLAQRMDLMAMGQFTQLVDHHNIGKTLNNMHWFTVETDPGGPEFFTSDQPLMTRAGFAGPNAFVCVPIGPHRVFWAVRDRGGEREIRERETAGMISLINELVVMQAHARSYATHDRHQPFMQEWLALAPHVSWFTRLSDKWAADSVREP